jgi:hypothetical protein
MRIHKLHNHATNEEKKNHFKYFCENCNIGTNNETVFNKHLETNKHKMRINN